jgi:lipoprotein-anchoring transpeptidase ErfK/SrfK
MQSVPVRRQHGSGNWRARNVAAMQYTAVTTSVLGNQFHGCVRLSPPNAAKLYSLVESKGVASTKVVVTGRIK